MTVLEVGSKLPDMEVVDQNGKGFNLRKFVGKLTVIYFYPKDQTPGCIKEACSFRDTKSMFQGVNVVGVSTQSIDSHDRFTRKYGLNFPLIADEDTRISKFFGVLRETGVANRTTFIFDKDGILVFVYPKVDPEGHAVEVLNKMKEMKLI